MTELSFSPYTLYPAGALNAKAQLTPRHGALLKIEKDDGQVGYADLHPWPELGDLALEENIESLRQAKMNQQLKQTLWFAERDAQARARGVHLLSEGTPLKNNYLVANIELLTLAQLTEAKSVGFDTVKIKVGRNLQQELQALRVLTEVDMKIRFDFNSSLTEQSFAEFMEQLDPRIPPRLEYIEDPFPFEAQAWGRARHLAPIALDNEYSRVDWENLSEKICDFIILKPAKSNIDLVIKLAQLWNCQIAVTSNMDHAVGIVHAMSVAMELKEKYDNLICEAGCMTQHLYRTDPFFAELQSQGPFLREGRGTGVGFNKLLEALPWQSL